MHLSLLTTVQLNSSPLCNDKLTETTIIAPKGIKSNVTQKENLLPYFVREIFSSLSRDSMSNGNILFFNEANF